METHRPDAPITLDRLNRQLQAIAQKVNKALKPPLGTAITALFSSGAVYPATPGAVDAAVVATAMQESDALLLQVRSASEMFASEPAVLQLEVAVWMQRAQIEHCAGRFRQASAAYEQAARLLLSVEHHRAAGSYSTEDALTQSVSCVLYACAELVEQAERDGKFRLQQHLSAAAAAAATTSHLLSAAAATEAMNQQQAAAAASAPAAAAVAPSAQEQLAQQPKTLGNRLSNWFKGLPSIQPANSQAAKLAAEEQDSLRRQREAERAAKLRSEAVWRALPVDTPHRFAATPRVTVLLRFMAGELLRLDAVDLAGHFADLSARYCLDYVTPSGAGEVVPPPATAATAAGNSSGGGGASLIPVKTALCRLPLVLDSGSIAAPNATGASQQPQKQQQQQQQQQRFTCDPDVEFCAVKPVAPTVRHIFAESMLLSVGCSLVLRQYERVRVMATFALFVLEPMRGESFALSVPQDMLDRSMAAAAAASSPLDGPPSSSSSSSAVSATAAAPAIVVIPNNAPTCYFVPVTVMKGFSLRQVRQDEDCALIGLSIVLAALCMRRVPFAEIAAAHVAWWRRTFVDLFGSTTTTTTSGEDEKVAAARSAMMTSETLSWRVPVADALDEFVAAVEAARKQMSGGGGSQDERPLGIFAAVDRLREPLLRRSQMLGLAAHRLYEIYAEGLSENRMLASIVKVEGIKAAAAEGENAAGNAAERERYASNQSPKLH